MGLFIAKPISYSGANALGAVATFESTFTSSQDVTGYIRNDNSNTANVGWETSPTDTEWANGGSGHSFWVGQVSALGSNTSPTIASLNNHPLITTYYHGSATGSWNGHQYQDGPSGGSVMTWNQSSLTFTFSDGSDTVSLTDNHVVYIDGTTTSSSGVRTVGNDHNDINVYLNGILYGSQSGGGSSSPSGNEYYQDDTYGTTFQYTTPRSFTSGDFSTKVQGTFGGSTFVNQGRYIDIESLSATDSQKITALLKAIDRQTYNNFKKEL